MLTRTFTPQAVDAAIASADRAEVRNRLLPARVVVYYVLAMCLYSGQGYEEVIRLLVGGLEWMSRWRRAWTVPSTAAIAKARARLGAEPLRALFRATVRPLATEATGVRGIAGCGWSPWTGATLDVPDTAENDEHFGRPGSSRGEGAFPQIGLVGVAECRTHAVFAAAATGADLWWRATTVFRLPVLRELPDGSYLSHLIRTDHEPITVRVIEYTIADGRAPEGEHYRLITTLLDPNHAAALELAELYAQRWEFETALDELKTHRHGAKVVLRSKSPDGVEQEVWAFLLVHWAIRELRHTAALDVDPRPRLVPAHPRACSAHRHRAGRQFPLTD